MNAVKIGEATEKKEQKSSNNEYERHENIQSTTGSGGNDQYP